MTACIVLGNSWQVTVIYCLQTTIDMSTTYVTDNRRDVLFAQVICELFFLSQ